MNRADEKRRRDESDDPDREKMNKKKTMTKKKKMKEKEEEEEGGYHHMPEEIQREIFLRLPVKSLFRFRFASKRLYHLISSEQFVSDHHKASQCGKDLALFNHWWSTHHHPCRYVDGVHPQDLVVPCEEKVKIVDYCNGVICLIRRRSKTYNMMLWNPTIRRTVAIPSLPRCVHPRINSATGFGFGSVNDDYKLVVVPGTCRKGTPLKANVFSLKSGNWGSVTCSWTNHVGIVSQHSVFVNGACHWLARNERHHYYFLSFNLREEAFGKIVVPNYLGPTGEVNRNYFVSIFIYKGCLSLVASMYAKNNNFVAWAMKEYGVVDSWIRIMENTNLRGVGAVVGFREEGDVVYIRSGVKELVCYDPVTEKSQRLKANHGVLLHCRYRESLVLIRQDFSNGGELN